MKVHHQVRVNLRLVDGQQHYLNVATSEQGLHFLNGGLVNVESAHLLPHRLVEKPSDRFDTDDSNSGIFEVGFSLQEGV